MGLGETECGIFSWTPSGHSPQVLTYSAPHLLFTINVPALQQTVLFIPVHLVLLILFTVEVCIMATNFLIFSTFPEHVKIASRPSCVGVPPRPRRAPLLSAGCEHHRFALFLSAHFLVSLSTFYSLYFYSISFVVLFFLTPSANLYLFIEKFIPHIFAIKQRLLSFFYVFCFLCFLTATIYFPF